jgi:D-alanine-D-alanine ligase
MNDLQMPPNFFGENSPFLNHPLLTPERTAVEVDFVVKALDLSPGMRVLDVGCGFGRHSLELARRGYQVLGIDPSSAMIAAARQRAAEAASGVRLEYLCAAGETFAAEQPFDAAFALFTTLGQVSTSGENSGLVGRVYESLVFGGRFLVEVPQRAVAAANLKTAERFGNDAAYTAITRQYDSHSQYVMEQFKIVNEQGTQEFLLQYRLYSWPELEKLLNEVGFQALQSFGGYDGRPLTAESPIMLASAIK